MGLLAISSGPAALFPNPGGLPSGTDGCFHSPVRFAQKDPPGPLPRPCTERVRLMPPSRSLIGVGAQLS